MPDLSADTYYNLQLAKENTTTQTKSNSHIRIVGSILSRSVHSYCRRGKFSIANSNIITQIKDVFIILTSRMTDSQMEYPAMSRIEIRAKQVFDATKLNLSIYNNGRLRKVFMTEAELRID